MLYDCFISYARADEELARKLEHRLQSAGFQVWRDKTRLQPGCKWSDEIATAVQQSRMVLPVLTPQWRQSDWTLFETYAAASVIPVLAKGNLAEVTPQPLQQIHAQAIDFNDPADPGWDKLVAAIRNTPPGQLTTAPRRPRPLHTIHFPMPPPQFFGRDVELGHLTQKLSELSPSVVLIVGLGGQGKSSLVAHWLAHGGQSHFSGVVWCTASEASVTFDTFLDESLSYLLEGRYSKLEVPTAEARVQLLLNRMRAEPVLIVIDGLESWLPEWTCKNKPQSSRRTGELHSTSSSGLVDFLREATSINSGSHLVCTTRTLPQALQGGKVAHIPIAAPGQRAELEGLDDGAAIGVLLSFGVQGDTRALLDEAHKYANHALALNVLGGLAREQGGVLPATEKAFDPQDRLGWLLQESTRSLPNRSMVEGILGILGHCIEDPDIDTVWACLSQFGPSGWLRQVLRFIGSDRSRPLTPPPSLEEQLGQLAKLSLIQWNHRTRTLKAHPVVKQFFANKISDSEGLHRILALHYARRPLPTGDDARVGWGRDYAVRHALKSADPQLAYQILRDFVSPRQTLLDWLAGWGHFVRGIELLEPLSRDLSGFEQLEVRIVWASFQKCLGQYSSAIDALDGVITELRTSSSDLEVTLAGCLMNRGNAKRMLSPKESLTDFEEATSLLEKRPPDSQLGMVYLNRSIALRDLGHLACAISDCDRAVTIFREDSERTSGASAAELADALCSRGNALADARRHAEALRDLNEAEALLTKSIASGRSDLQPKLAHARTLRGATLDESGRHAEARHDFDRAIQTLDALVSGGRRDLEHLLALAYMDRSRSFLYTHEWQSSLADSDKAVAAFTRLEGAYRSAQLGRLGHALLNRADARMGMGDIQGARADQEEGFAITRKLINEGRLDLRVIAMRKVVSALEVILERNPEELVDYFQRTLYLFDFRLWENNRTEELQAECHEIAARMPALVARLTAQGISEEWVGLLRRMVDSPLAEVIPGPEHLLSVENAAIKSKPL